MTKSLVVL